MHKTTSKIRIYEEDVKTQHTTHWDWDYLTQAQLDEMITTNRSQHRFKLSALFRRLKTHRRRTALMAATLLWALAMVAVAIRAFA